jgi:capsular exopolysaccharide synthesis family protein
VQPGSETLDLEQAISVVRRRLPLIVLCAVVVAGAAYGFSKHETKKYRATSALIFGNNQLSQQIAGLPLSSTNNQLAQQDSNLELVRLGDTAAKTASRLGHGLTEQKVSRSLSIDGQGESSIVVVSATTTSPTLAAEIANTYTHEFITEQQRSNHQYFRSALALVNKQLAAIPQRQRFSAAAVALQNRAQTLRLLNELQYGNVRIAGVAAVPSSPSSPKTSRNVVLGGFLGLLIGLCLAFILERLNRRIRGPEGLETIYGLPLLGVIPESAALSESARRGGGRRALLPPAEAEAFNLLRAHLRFFNVERDLRTVVIASATPSDGKTTISCRLAESAARVGARVLLLEVDLRRPTLTRQLDIQPGPGLAEVLVGAVSMHEATQTVSLAIEPGKSLNKGRTLDVLAAGPVLPPNPAELLDGHAMDAVLQQAKSVYDLVVIDTPPLTVVSDAFPLLTKVDGVVIVGWIGRSRCDAAEQLHQVLASSGSPLLGVIANGSKARGPSAYVSSSANDASRDIASSNGTSPPENVPTAKV